MDLCDTAFARPFIGRRFYAACAALFMTSAAVVAAPAAGPPPDPVGEWRVAKGVAIIRVVNCDGQYWGVVSWEQNPGIDNKNPDPKTRNRPTLGMPILLGMTQSGSNEWSGQIYNSEDGRTYTAKISLANPDTLQVQGCVFGFLCGGENWSRVNTESTTGVAPGSPKPSPGPSGARTATPLPTARPTQQRAATPPQSAQPPSPHTQSAEEICLSLVGPPGGPHQRGLK